MKRTIGWSKIIIIAGACTLASASGDDAVRRIPASNIVAGGRLSQGPGCKVMHAIGMTSRGRAAGGNYSMRAGFLAQIEVMQAASLPTLQLVRSGNSVIVYWPALASAIALEQSEDMRTWRRVNTAVVPSGAYDTVTEPIHAPRKFYRLMVVAP